MSDILTDAFASLLSPRERAARLEGQTLGNWRLEERLANGEGGFGVVYRASHKQLGQGAVKVLAFDLRIQPELRPLFEREIEIHEKLTKSNEVQRVARIYDAGVYEETLPWFAMQYVDGTPLNRWIAEAHARGTPIPLQRVISILRDVLVALEGLHGAGIVHRDIKPGNVMVVSDQGRDGARLIDFGIAKILGSAKDAASRAAGNETIQTLAGNAVTRSYAAPEMLAPYTRREAVDVRSDIFQVGLLGYEMLTFERYWDIWPDIAPGLKIAQCPRGLKRTILRALEWNRDRRFADVRTFRRYLETPWRVRVTRAELWNDRRRVIAVVAILVAIIAATIVIHQGRVAKHQLLETEAARQEILDEWQVADSKISSLQTENENLQANIKILKALLPSEVSTQETNLTILKEDYKKLKDGRATWNDFERTRSEAASFAMAYPKHRNCPEVRNLSAWLEAASKGSIRITVTELKEHNIRSDWKMGYEIAADGQVKASEACLVTKGRSVNSATEVRWNPETRVTVTLTCDDYGYRDSDDIVLGLPHLLLLEKNGRYYNLKASKDHNFELWYKIEHVGFDALPPFLQ